MVDVPPAASRHESHRGVVVVGSGEGVDLDGERLRGGAVVFGAVEGSPQHNGHSCIVVASGYVRM